MPPPNRLCAYALCSCIFVIQWTPLIVATSGPAISGHYICGILVLMWILGHDFSGHYNRLALISMDIISGVYSI